MLSICLQFHLHFITLYTLILRGKTIFSMKNKLVTLCLIFGLFITSNAQSGKVFDNLTMTSKILKGERKYAVYLPPDYETSERSYPVLYLLHGATDDHTGWVQFGEVMGITDEAIRNGNATPMVIIMPDADTGRMGYFNAGDWKYEDFFFEEFMPHVEKKYRIKSEKNIVQWQDFQWVEVEPSCMLYITLNYFHLRVH